VATPERPVSAPAAEVTDPRRRIPQADPEGLYSVRQNVWPGEAKLTFARSATKHRISRERSLYVIEHCALQIVRYRHRIAANSAVDQRVVFNGDDLEGVALEIIAAERKGEEFLVIHAMDLRNRFRGLYEEARKWER